MTKRHTRTKTVLAASLLAFGMTAVLTSSANAAPVDVPLGTAGSYAILAGTTITKTGPITVSGDIGVSPGTAVSGTGVITQTGVIHAGDAAADIAKDDLVTGYNNAAAQTPPQPITADLAGQNLKAGVYNSATSLDLNGALTLDGEGNADSVFVFQAGSTLITGPGSSVNLVNGANPCNVYWQVGSSATLGTTTDFVGTIMALTSITLDTGATVDGRVLARNGAVTLDSNTVTRPLCASATPTPTPTPSTPAPTDGTPTTPAPTDGTPTDGDDSTDTPDGTPTGDTPDTTTQIVQKPRGPVDTGR